MRFPRHDMAPEIEQSARGEAEAGAATQRLRNSGAERNAHTAIQVANANARGAARNLKYAVSLYFTWHRPVAPREGQRAHGAAKKVVFLYLVFQQAASGRQ